MRRRTILTRSAAAARRRVSARAALALVLGVSTSLAGAAPESRAAVDPKAREALRGRTFRGLDGSTVALESLRGQVVVINLWASWCAPCRKELPQLEELNAEISRRGGRVLAVSIDLERRNIDRFVRRHGLTLPVYHDGTEGVARRLDLKSVPYTIVLDRSGEVAYTGHGADARAIEQIKSVTRTLVAKAAVAAHPGE